MHTGQPGSKGHDMKIKILILFSLLLTLGCDDKGQNKEPSLSTKGELIIGVDESLKPVIDAEIAMFTVYYPESSIMPLYLPEKQVVEKLLTNEIQTGIICRDLTVEEIDIIEGNYSHKVSSNKLGYEKIVAIVNNTNPLNEISDTDLTGIISGKISNWDQLIPAFKDQKPILVVIPKSSNIDRYFFSSIETSSSIPAYALGTTPEVIDYVKENVSAIGIVTKSWLCSIKTEIPDIKIPNCFSKSTGNENRYPSFGVYAVTHEPFTGLGSGFISFMMGQKGQLILSKSGMAPNKPIEREIKISNSF